MQKTNNTFTMKHSRKELTALRDANIFKDFCDMYNKKGLRPDAIYDILSLKKYFLSKERLYRIVLKQSSKTKGFRGDKPG